MEAFPACDLHACHLHCRRLRLRCLADGLQSCLHCCCWPESMADLLAGACATLNIVPSKSSSCTKIDGAAQIRGSQGLVRWMLTYSKPCDALQHGLKLNGLLRNRAYSSCSCPPEDFMMKVLRFQMKTQ